jgi:hypothetical protein
MKIADVSHWNEKLAGTSKVLLDRRVLKEPPEKKGNRGRREK